MAQNIKVLAATPEVVDTIKKANVLVNKTSLNDQGARPTINNPKIAGGIKQVNELVPAKVVSGNGVIGYTCNIYGNGLDQQPTEVGTVFLANGGSTIFQLPVGTTLFVQKYSVRVFGGVND